MVLSFKWFHWAFDERIWESIQTRTLTVPFHPYDTTLHSSCWEKHFVIRLAYIPFSCPPQLCIPPLTSPAAFMLWHRLQCLTAQRNVVWWLISYHQKVGFHIPITFHLNTENKEEILSICCSGCECNSLSPDSHDLTVIILSCSALFNFIGF